ncbi:MAG: DHHW family protein [Clostridia bacterium]|nr:DHHW family protein [Clostridia bacterium]
MMKLKSILTIALFALAIFGFSALFLLLPAESYSMTERRSLAQKPELTWESLSEGKYMSSFEDYTLDQFPLRNTFRSIKAVSAKYLFRRMDNNDLYSVNGYLSKLDYPLDETRFSRSTDKIREVYEKFIAGTDCKIYLSVIPDKNCFLAPLGHYPSIGYNVFAERMKEAIDFAEYIDISDTVSLENFYYTDQHWRQETILDTAEALASGMGAEFSRDYTVNTLDYPFEGTYLGQSALRFPPDTIKYLTSDVLDHCIVTSYNTGKGVPSAIYDMNKSTGKDPYEMFLSGSDALITIENPDAKTDKELVIFRDSFGSSITPLLVAGYSKITLVDLRYIQSAMLPYFVEFKNQDVLFLYSTLVLNSTITM